MPWVSGDVKRLTLRESQGLQEVSLSRNWNYFAHRHYTFHCMIFWHFEGGKGLIREVWLRQQFKLKGERDSWIYEQKWDVTSEFFLPFLKTSIFLRKSHTRQIVDVSFLNSRRMKCFFKYRDAWNGVSTPPPPPLSPPFPSPFATLNYLNHWNRILTCWLACLYPSNYGADLG